MRAAQQRPAARREAQQARKARGQVGADKQAHRCHDLLQAEGAASVRLQNVGEALAEDAPRAAGLVTEELPGLENHDHVLALDGQILHQPLVAAVHPPRQPAAQRAGAIPPPAPHLHAVPSRGDVHPLAHPRVRVGEEERGTLTIMTTLNTVPYEICHPSPASHSVSWEQVTTHAQE